MKTSRSIPIKSALVAAVALGAFAAMPARAADSYVVCNQWNECWRVHERYTDYPKDAQVTYHDEAWRSAHEHDTHWKWLSDPADDHGWYDRDGAWHATEHPPEP
jgi:hypothetical protein